MVHTNTMWSDLKSSLATAIAAYAIGAYGADGVDSCPVFSPCKNETTPMQLHLAYAGATGMTVSWNTYSQISQPSVRYGLAPNKLYQLAFSEESITYPTSTTYNNHVKITGLEPNTLYYYKPLCSNVTYTFTTSREAGDHTPYSVAIVIDMGLMGPKGLVVPKNETTTIESLQQHKKDWEMLLHRQCDLLIFEEVSAN